MGYDETYVSLNTLEAARLLGCIVEGSYLYYVPKYSTQSQSFVSTNYVSPFMPDGITPTVTHDPPLSSGVSTFQTAITENLASNTLFGNPLQELGNWTLLELRATLNDEGLEVGVFKNNTTGQILLFVPGHAELFQNEDNQDAKYGHNPINSDQIPVTAFELVKIYKEIEQTYTHTEIILAGHSLGGGTAKIAGAILQSESEEYKESVKVINFSGIGGENLLDNLG